MEFSFLSQFGSIGPALVLFVGVVATHWAGYRLAHNWSDKSLSEGFIVINGPLLGLLALLLGFSFAAASARYEMRRNILVEEANAIGTVVLRADLYPTNERELFRADFKDYVEARIAFFGAGMSGDRLDEITRRSEEISQRIWQRAARLSQDQVNFVASQQMVPALNDMIDIVTTRNAARVATIPDAIMWVLLAMCLLSGFIVGFGRNETNKQWVANVIFALMVSSSIFLIIDLDRPSRGTITLDAANKHIVDLRGLFTNDH